MIIFLDIDGILVHNDYNPSKSVGRLDIDPACVEVLDKLCSATRAKIVISSTWRLGSLDKIEETSIGKRIIGATPILKDKGEEILVWIQDNKYTGDYLVIEDELLEIRDFIHQSHIIYVENGFMTGGLKQEHIDPFVNKGMIS